MQIDDVMLDTRAIMQWSETITPAAVSASIGMKEEAFTVANPESMRTTDIVHVTGPPGAVQAACAVIGARVSSTTQITLIFCNLDGVANTPTAGTHGFLVVRD